MALEELLAIGFISAVTVEYRNLAEVALRRLCVAEQHSPLQRSRRVMERCGMRYLRTFHVEFDDPLPGTEHGETEYELTVDEWQRHRP